MNSEIAYLVLSLSIIFLYFIVRCVFHTLLSPVGLSLSLTLDYDVVSLTVNVIK